MLKMENVNACIWIYIAAPIILDIAGFTGTNSSLLSPKEYVKKKHTPTMEIHERIVIQGVQLSTQCECTVTTIGW